MKLLQLTLENFQGIKSKVFEFNGNNASLYGDNATGKTTVFNAMTWLLFDKASTGSKNFTPKTKGPDGDMHHLSHLVEGVIEVQAGCTMVLTKVYHENYKKKRGSSDAEFDGHSVDFFINNVPTKEKEYNETILGMCGDDMEKIKLLTMPNYFPEEMPWEERREMLLDTCGDITDEDVIKSDIELLELNAYLLMPGTKDQHYSVDEYKKIAGAQKTDINKQLQDIPVRIDEAEKAKPDTRNISPLEINSAIEGLNTQLKELEEEKSLALNSDTAVNTIKQKISDLNTQLAEARTKHATEGSKSNESTYAAISELKPKISKLSNDILDKKGEISRNHREKERIATLRAQLLDEYTRIQGETWNEGQALCPTCSRPLPEDKVQELREKFNLDKGARLEANTKRGRTEASKDLIQKLDSEVTRLNDEIDAAEQSITDLNEQLAALNSKIEVPRPFETTQTYENINAQVSKCRKELLDKDSVAKNAVSEIEAKISITKGKIRIEEGKLSQIKLAEIQEKRIKNLMAEEKELSAAFEGIEKGIYLCELFVKTKVGMLDEKINSKFKCVRFRLFIEQLNGGISECCDVMVPSDNGSLVPYSFANNGARINAGLEIIDTLSKHWVLTIPVFVDNAESVTQLIKMDTQLIRLVVSEPDKVLRLEIEGKVEEVKTKKAVTGGSRGRK